MKNKNNIKVVISLGAKTPYFPEFHLPDEILTNIKFAQSIDENHIIAQDLLTINRKVVKQLSGYANISHWQIENEPLIGNANRITVEPALIAKEVEIIRETDPEKRLIILNHAGVGFYDARWKELLALLNEQDVFAMNAFFKTRGTDLFNGKIAGVEFHIKWPGNFTWPVQSWPIFSPNFSSVKQDVEKQGNDFWILEMQAEPYVTSVDAAGKNNLTYTANDLQEADNYLKSHNIKSIGLWGAEFWKFREKNGDNSWINTVKNIVND